MTRLPFQLHKARRATAWFLLLLCAWMGTGGVLHHADAEPLVSGRTHAPAGMHRQAAAAPADTCAACEWTQGLQGRPLAVFVVLSPFFVLRPRSLALTPAPLRRALRLRSPRAPPVFLTNV